MKSKIGLGVISFAHGHANLYCQRLATYDDVQLVGAWDDDGARGSAAAEQYDMRYSPHLEDLLDDPAIQGVIVTCETNRHAEMVEAAARAGKHILRRLIGHPYEEAPHLYREASPSAQEPFDAHVVAIHTADDETIPLIVSRRYVQLMTERGQTAELVVVPGEGHSAFCDPRSRANRETARVLGI